MAETFHENIEFLVQVPEDIKAATPVYFHENSLYLGYDGFPIAFDPVTPATFHVDSNTLNSKYLELILNLAKSLKTSVKVDHMPITFDMSRTPYILSMETMSYGKFDCYIMPIQKK